MSINITTPVRPPGDAWLDFTTDPTGPPLEFTIGTTTYNPPNTFSTPTDQLLTFEADIQLPARTTLTPNLVSNPSVETTLDDWSMEAIGFSGDPIVRTNAWASDGYWSVRATRTKDNNNTLREMKVWSSAMAVAGNAGYELEIDVNILDPGTRTLPFIEWKDAPGTTLDITDINYGMTVGFRRFAITGVAPLAATKARVGVRIESDVANDIIDFYLDNANFNAIDDRLVPAVSSKTLTYEWDFGDGTKGYGSPVTHIYTTANEHIRVTLTVTDDQHRVFQMQKQLYVRDLGELAPGQVILVEET